MLIPNVAAQNTLTIPLIWSWDADQLYFQWRGSARMYHIPSEKFLQVPGANLTFYRCGNIIAETTNELVSTMLTAYHTQTYACNLEPEICASPVITVLIEYNDYHGTAERSVEELKETQHWSIDTYPTPEWN